MLDAIDDPPIPRPALDPPGFPDLSLSEAEINVRGLVKGTAGYYRLRPRVLALELVEALPDGRGSQGDFIVVGEDGESGTLYEREAFLKMFERIHFIEDFHEPRLPGGQPMPAEGEDA